MRAHRLPAGRCRISELSAVIYCTECRRHHLRSAHDAFCHGIPATSPQWHAVYKSRYLRHGMRGTPWGTFHTSHAADTLTPRYSQRHGSPLSHIHGQRNYGVVLAYAVGTSLPQIVTVNVHENHRSWANINCHQLRTATHVEATPPGESSGPHNEFFGVHIMLQYCHQHVNNTNTYRAATTTASAGPTSHLIDAHTIFAEKSRT